MYLIYTSTPFRYLKFKFLSHYGDEFYCTVSQVKVHGSTMLESFQHEWQQSSAEVREVQDFMKKKDPKPSGVAAAAAAAVGGGDNAANNVGVSAQGGGDGSVGGGAHGSKDEGSGAHPTPGGVPSSSNAGKAAPATDGTVEHRPHAASAATVTSGSKRATGGGVGGSAASGAGVGTATVEDIVRGVPAEMVVPAPTTTCVGPTGTDGSCRGEVLVDKVASRGGVAGSAASLSSEIPTMGGAGAPAPGDLVDSAMVDGGGEGLGASSGSVGADDGKDALRASTDDDLDRPFGGGEGATGAGDRRNGEKAPLASGQEDPPLRVENKHQLESDAIDGSAAAEAEAATATNAFVDAGDGGGLEDGGFAAGEVSDAPAEGGEGTQPPRKGIIHSTMEAISKAVHRGEGSKPKDDTAGTTAAKSAGAAGDSGDDGSGGSTVSSDASVDGAAAVVDDGDVGSLSPEASGSASASAGIGGEAGGDGSVRQGEVDDKAGVPDAAAVDAAPGAPAGGEPPAAGESDPRSTVAVHGREPSHAASGHGASEGIVAPPAQHAGEVAHDPGGVDDQADAVGSAGENLADRENGGNAPGGSDTIQPKIFESENVDSPNPRPGGSGVHQTEGDSAAEPAREGDGGQHQHADSTMVESAGAGVGEGGADHTLPATAISHATHDESTPSQGSGRLPSTTQAHDGASAPAMHGQTQGVEPALPVLLLEETNAATLTAACLNTLSFSEFRDEVLARTQQAQQSAGGGVAIGGQYESIFKTLMNKIKTLEINQSLYSLYIGTSWLGIRTVEPRSATQTHRDSGRLTPCSQIKKVGRALSAACRTLSLRSLVFDPPHRCHFSCSRFATARPPSNPNERQTTCTVVTRTSSRTCSKSSSVRANRGRSCSTRSRRPM